MNIATLGFIIVLICLLYFTCGRFGYLINLIIYVTITGLLPDIIPFLNFGIQPLWLNLLIRLFMGVFLIKRLTIIYERIESPIAFLATGIVLELIFTVLLCYFSEYVIAITIVFGIAAFASLLYVSDNNEILGSNPTRDIDMGPRNMEINNIKARNNLFGKWFGG